MTIPCDSGNENSNTITIVCQFRNPTYCMMYGLVPREFLVSYWVDSDGYNLFYFCFTSEQEMYRILPYILWYEETWIDIDPEDFLFDRDLDWFVDLLTVGLLERDLARTTRAKASTVHD